MTTRKREKKIEQMKEKEDDAHRHRANCWTNARKSGNEWVEAEETERIEIQSFYWSDQRNHIGKMSFPLHAHHILILATVTFVVAVTTPEWYISRATGLKMNIFQICAEKSGLQICEWTLSTYLNNKLFEKSQFCRFVFHVRNQWCFHVLVRVVYPIVTALFAIICVATSLISLFLGSWHIQRFARENKAKWLPILISILVLLCCKSNGISESDFVHLYHSFSPPHSSLLLCCMDNDADHSHAADGISHIKNLLVKSGLFLLDWRQRISPVFLRHRSLYAFDFVQPLNHLIVSEPLYPTFRTRAHFRFHPLNRNQSNIERKSSFQGNWRVHISA